MEPVKRYCFVSRAEIRVFQYSVFGGKKRSSSCTLGGNSFVLGRFRYTQVTERRKRLVLVLVDNRNPAES